jgi:hypothetical protein
VGLLLALLARAHEKHGCIGTVRCRGRIRRIGINTTTLLIDELKTVVSRGAHPSRLVLMPTLRQLAGAENSPTYAAAGRLIREHLSRSISSLTGTFVFCGREYEAERIRMALRQILWTDGSYNDIPYVTERRLAAIKILGLAWPHSPSKWRRPVSPERELLEILATRMTASEALKAS